MEERTRIGGHGTEAKVAYSNKRTPTYGKPLSWTLNYNIAQRKFSSEAFPVWVEIIALINKS